MDFIGNAPAVAYFHKLIEKLSHGGFILLCGPQYIGKMTLIESVLDQIINPLYQLQDLMIIRDFSDQWLELKDSNDKITGSTHALKIEADANKIDIKLPDGTIYKDYGARDMIERFSRSPTGGKKLLVIENIERMTTGASNALLKTLEEPLEDRLIIGTCSDPNQLLPTIVSRGFLINFYPVPESFLLPVTSYQLPEEGSQQATGNRQQATSDRKLAMGRPGLAIRLSNIPKYQELAKIIQSIDESYFQKELLSVKQSTFTKLNEQGLLSLALDMLQVKFAENKIRHNKFIQTKKYLDSNVGVGNVMMDMLIGKAE